MNFKQLTHIELHEATIETAKLERQMTLTLLAHLNEITRRKLFAHFECGNLHAYCTKHLKLSDHQAATRVRAAKFLRHFPQAEAKLEAGVLNLSLVCLVSLFFEQESKAARFLERQEKEAILQEIENMSCRAAEKLLMAKTPKPEIHIRERLKRKSADVSQLTTLLDNETRENLEKLREIWSHSNSDGTLAEVIKRALELALEKVDPVEKAKRAETRAQKKSRRSTETDDHEMRTDEPNDNAANEIITSTEVPLGHFNLQTSRIATDKNAQPIPALIRHAVIGRDGYCCTFVNPVTGEKCECRWQLEFDHVIPRAVGGENTIENLRVRCRTHNQYSAAQMFGRKTTRFWRNA